MTSKTFEGVLDRYNGVTVDSQHEPCDHTILLDQIKKSLQKWAEGKKRCIWFQVNIKDATWVPILAAGILHTKLLQPICIPLLGTGLLSSREGLGYSPHVGPVRIGDFTHILELLSSHFPSPKSFVEGFNFHHSRGDYVMMYKWLPTDSTHNLPPPCHTNLGVGGMVFNDKNQLLVVAEKSINYPHWKLPGGYVERREDIKDAAIREVREETGIESSFESMITLRHTHNSMFGNSDIYVVVKLRAISAEITKSDIEIEACKWMDVEEFLVHPHVHEFNRFIVRQALDLERRNIKLALPSETITIGKMTRDIVNLVIEDL